MSIAIDGIVNRSERVATQIAVFRSLAPIAASVGVAFPTSTDVDRAVGFILDADIARILADLDAVVTAHATFTAAADAVTSGAIDTAWIGRSANAAMVAIDDHARAGDVDLSTLVETATAAASALSGLITLLRKVFEAIDIVGSSTLGGHPVASVPAALSAGILRPAVVADEIGARVELFDTATNVGRAGMSDILGELVGVEPIGVAAAVGGEQPGHLDAHAVGTTGQRPPATSAGDLALAGDR